MSRFPLPEAKFQYKVIHLLIQILEEQCKIGAHYELEHSSYHVKKFDDLEEFEKFDNELSDVVKHQLLKRQLIMVGGSSCHANVKAILLMLMTNKLMACYNMEGKHKKAFKKTNVIRVITDPMTKYTIHEVHHSIGNILKRAPDRKDGGGRGDGKAVEEEDFFHNKSL
ncbi:uncharacterized protein LOC136088999 [Hydra vulgaris]|uniref:Uncharacterized protein LOC136088999 n=1 Tax=Hydra vulgaris TaxID=6087 RepID=A0ABM4D7Z5_HYDVU